MKKLVVPYAVGLTALLLVAPIIASLILAMAMGLFGCVTMIPLLEPGLWSFSMKL